MMRFYWAKISLWNKVSAFWVCFLILLKLYLHLHQIRVYNLFNDIHYLVMCFLQFLFFWISPNIQNHKLSPQAKSAKPEIKLDSETNTNSFLKINILFFSLYYFFPILWLFLLITCFSHVPTFPCKP